MAASQLTDRNSAGLPTSGVDHAGKCITQFDSGPIIKLNGDKGTCCLCTPSSFATSDLRSKGNKLNG